MRNNSGGALLFAIITAFVLSFVATTLVYLGSNQYRIIDNDIDRTRAFYLAKGYVQLAIYHLYSGTAGWVPVNDTITHEFDTNDDGFDDLRIEITHPDSISSYRIKVTSAYWESDLGEAAE